MTFQPLECSRASDQTHSDSLEIKAKQVAESFRFFTAFCNSHCLGPPKDKPDPQGPRWS